MHTNYKWTIFGARQKLFAERSMFLFPSCIELDFCKMTALNSSAHWNISEYYSKIKHVMYIKIHVYAKLDFYKMNTLSAHWNTILLSIRYFEWCSKCVELGYRTWLGFVSTYWTWSLVSIPERKKKTGGKKGELDKGVCWICTEKSRNIKLSSWKVAFWRRHFWVTRTRIREEESRKIIKKVAERKWDAVRGCVLRCSRQATIDKQLEISQRSFYDLLISIMLDQSSRAPFDDHLYPFLGLCKIYQELPLALTKTRVSNEWFCFVY